ncbi:MAG: conjugative transposon protein TraK [Terrimonas sp.]|nr:conjugative transposon protein TraK [Terrimonas sp.]OJY97908.1 MAG: conjugative transposon protein TraK [Sphingobacteriales bacterium 40-81]
MFKQMKNIDTAFRHVRLFSLFFLVGCMVVSLYALYLTQKITTNAQNKIFVLANSKALEAYASERKENIPAEAKDHVNTFHQLFFNVTPDNNIIQRNISRALYLADRSAKQHYDNLKESGYYTNVMSGNVSQELSTDSIYINLDAHPYYFRFHGTLQIIRTTSIATRSLVTEGVLRSIARSDNNSHGFLIEKWNIIENRDIKIQNR